MNQQKIGGFLKELRKEKNMTQEQFAVVYMVLEIMNLTDVGVYEDIASFSLGLVFGILLVGVIATSRYMSKIRAFKMRLLKRGEV